MAEGSTRGRGKRRWFQFGLGTLLIITTLVCVGLAYWDRQVKGFRKQAEVAAELSELGARVEYEAFGPRWLSRIYGKDTLRDVVLVHLERRGSRVSDRQLEQLVHLPRLRRLYLARTGVTDETLDRLRTFRYLERISLWHTAVSDDGMGHLADLQSLEVLDVQHCSRLTPDGLSSFENHPKLKRLIHSIPIDDDAIASLTRIPHLKCSRLDCLDVTDEGLKRLAHISGINSLTIRSSGFTHRGLAAIADLPKLKNLTLVTSRLDDDGLKSLYQIGQVRGVHLGLKSPRTDLSEIARFAGDRVSSVIVRPNEVILIGPSLYLHVWGSADPAGFSFLETIPSLDSLEIQGVLTNEDIRTISRVDSLKVLKITHPGTRGVWRVRFARGDTLNVSADAVRTLGRLGDLSHLELHGTRWNDEQLGFLGDLHQLSTLALTGQAIQGECLSQLRRLPRLTSLRVDNCPMLRDESLAHLRGLERLQTLSLADTPITDAGLARIRDLDSLTQLTLYNTRVSDNGKKELLSRLPKQINVH